MQKTFEQLIKEDREFEIKYPKSRCKTCFLKRDCPGTDENGLCRHYISIYEGMYSYE